MNVGVAKLKLSPYEAYMHGLSMVLLDGLGIGTGLSTSLKVLREDCYNALLAQLPGTQCQRESSFLSDHMQHLVKQKRVGSVVFTDTKFGMDPFYILKGTVPKGKISYALNAPTTSGNAMRVLRALQLPKPILLEGSPGVGKTSLITAIAAASNHRVVRINLSEQTDLMDLLGSDLPGLLFIV